MTSPIFSSVLPAVLALVMFGLGLGLTLADFARVARAPRAVGVTLAVQVLVLPPLCFGLVTLVDLGPDIALGMMVLAAAPGGVMATVFTHLAEGDVAVSITTTAVNAVLSLVTMPLIIALALAHFLGDGALVSVPPDKVLTVVVVLVLPVVLGMAVRRRRPDLADRAASPVRVASVVVVFLAIVVAVASQFGGFLLGLAATGAVVVTLSVLALGLGYVVPRLSGVSRPQAIAAAMEIGIHNAVVAITVCVSVLDNPAAAVAPAMYGALMFGPAAVAAWLFRRRTAPSEPAVPPTGRGRGVAAG